MTQNDTPNHSSSSSWGEGGQGGESFIAHIDADAFFASVLQRKYPKLRGKPLLALGMGGGCVIAASYEAKRMGVKTGMRLKDAKKLAPGAIAMPSDFRATSLAREEFFSVLEKFCPGGVEKTSVDEGYLDLHCWGPVGARGHAPLQDMAITLQSTIHRFLDLPVSIGIAPSKTLAKMGSKHNKPRGICIIEQKDIDAFLKQKPIEEIPSIGRRLTPKLQRKGFRTAFDLAHAPKCDIKMLLGKTGLELQAELNGEAIYAIVTKPDPPKSISRCRSFWKTSDQNFLYAQIVTHLQKCSSKLRRHEMECAGVGVWLREGYESKIYAERKIGRYICEEALLLPFVKEAFSEACHTEEPRRSVSKCTAAKRPKTHYTQAGLILFDFRKKGPRQISVFEEHDLDRITSLQNTLDSAREKFGWESVQYGSAMKYLIQ